MTAVAGAAPFSLYVNGRFRAHRTTGVRRYAEEILARMGRDATVIEPRSQLKGPRGHVWEQVALPAKVGRGLLWSPCNTGPFWFPRQVVTIHDMFPMDHPEWFSKTFLQAWRLIVPAVIRGARRVIAVSEYTKRCIMEFTAVPAGKIEVIHSGIGEQFVPASESSIAAARQAIGLAKGRYLLSVSSLEPRKNVAGLLQAWEKALPLLPPDLHLVLAGGTGSTTVFAGLNLQTVPERVLLPGYVAEEHLPGLYSGARAFVFPSLAEGFGFPPLEAMACGTPVVTSATTSLLEICQGAALLVEPTDTSAIAAAIHQIAADDQLCSRLQVSGRERAANFDWEVTASRTWNLLNSELTTIERSAGKSPEGTRR
jgi:glycosyltransferase involved in cell wall biosynthesis